MELALEWGRLRRALRFVLARSLRCALLASVPAALVVVWWQVHRQLGPQGVSGTG